MSESVQGYTLLVKPKDEPRIHLFVYAVSGEEAVAKAKTDFPEASILIIESTKKKAANRVYSSKEIIQRWRRDHRMS